MLGFAESGHPVVPCHESIVQRSAQKQRRWKIVDTQLCRLWKRFKLLFEQLLLQISSVFTEQSQKCVKNMKPLHDRTGKPVAGGQSSSSFVPSVVKTDVPSDSDDRAHKDLLLQKYGERIEKLSQQDTVDQILYGCRIPECC